MNPLDLTVAQIAPAFPGALLANIGQHLPTVLHALEEAQLTTPRLVAFALATIAAETAGFMPISERVSRFNTHRKSFDLYDSRKNLGNRQPGDGAKYRGRGFVQLTGKDNYTRYGERIGVDLVANPERACESGIAAQLLALFVADRAEAIETALSASDFAKARRLVNGGSHGLERFTNAYKTIFGVLQSTTPP